MNTGKRRERNTETDYQRLKRVMRMKLRISGGVDLAQEFITAAEEARLSGLNAVMDAGEALEVANHGKKAVRRYRLPFYMEAYLNRLETELMPEPVSHARRRTPRRHPDRQCAPRAPVQLHYHYA